MNHKSSSSSASATPPPLPPPIFQTTFSPRSASGFTTHTNSTATRTPAIIPLDYNYQTMSPSSFSQFPSGRLTSAATTNTSAAYHLNTHSLINSARPQTGSASVDVELDNQYSSLFGDPVPPPPPPDFLTTQFNPVNIFHPVSLDISSGSEEDANVSLTALGAERSIQTRLFSNVPFSSVFSRRASDTTTTQRNFDVLPMPMPRLQPPDIQILPNSSGDSSSEARESPNYTLLAPEMAERQGIMYENSEPSDMTEIVESYEVRDMTGVREYSEAKRRVSNFSEDFKSNVGAFSNTQVAPQTLDSPSATAHQFSHPFSNEPYTSNDWFRPATQDYPEFSKIPRLRPSSKNIMSIKREDMPMHHSPVAAMINDSNGSSSGDDRQTNETQSIDQGTVLPDVLQPPARPPDPSPMLLREIETDLMLSPREYLQQENDRSMDSLKVENFTTPPPPAAPPPPDFLTPVTEESQSPVKRELSPVILRDLIATGGEFRVDQPRLHKKSSFTIISEKSPQSSRAHSPSSYSQKRSPSKISGPNPVAKPRHYLKQKSLSATQLKLPQIPQHRLQAHADDSPRPSVQFNMTGRHTPNMMTPRGILQHRESMSSSQDVTPLSPSSTRIAATKLRRPSTLPSFPKQVDETKMKSCEALPFITDPYRTVIPRFNRSVTDLQREPAVFPPGALPRPLKPNPNPTRKQKGLLRILNGDNSHIPLRSNWASMDDLYLGRNLKKPPPLSSGIFLSRRRSSSTSPERRSSTQTASDRRSSNISSVTTSDFSFRRASTTSQMQRRKSLFPSSNPQTKRRQSSIPPASSSGGRISRAKVVKPTTLSPIIGTPNKDNSSPQSPEKDVSSLLAPSETPSDINARRESLSKIPIRASNSRPGSRSSSPLKEFVAQLPISDPTSRATSSRTTSRATMRTDASLTASRVNSRLGSRSTSRASTHPISRAASRASSRPNSRMDMAKQIANSRSNSRLSILSATSNADNVSPVSGKISTEPLPILARHRRKSISVSPATNRRVHGRRQSLSPPNKKRSGSRGRGKKTRERSESRRSSQSHIPLRSGSLTKVMRSSPKSKNSKRSRSRSPKSKDSKPAPRPLPIRSPTRTTELQRKKTISAKKVPTSVHKPESSVRRSPSSVSKSAPSVKKQPNNLQKSGGMNIRREISNLQKKGKEGAKSATGKPVRREGTTPTMTSKRTSGGAATAAVALAASGLKRQATSKNLGKTTTKSRMSAVKENTGERKTQGATQAVTGGESTDENADSTSRQATGIPTGTEATKMTAANTATVKGTTTMSSGSTGSSVGSTTTIKRNPSNMSLVRMASRMSLLSMKRSDSNLSRKTAVPAVAEEATDDSKKNGISGGATLQKNSSRAQLKTPEDVAAAAILEKSQKTLENVQKSVTVATDEIHKTIIENLTDLKSLENDMARFSDSATSPTSSVATVVENKVGSKAGTTVGMLAAGESGSRTATAEGPTSTASTIKPTHKNGNDASQAPLASNQKSPLPPTQPIEADVSVLNSHHATVAAATAVAATTGATAMPHAGVVDATVERNYTYDGDGAADKTADGAVSTLMSGEVHTLGTDASGRGRKDVGRGGGAGVGGVSGSGGVTDDDIKRRSPDGQGGSAAGSGNGSREFLQEPEDDQVPPTGCCRCCAKFCLPCRRLRCSRCCRRKKSIAGGNESEEPVLSATSSTSTTNLEVINEAQHTADGGASKRSCWQKLNCCKRCRKQLKVDEPPSKMTVAAKAETGLVGAPKQGKCGLCMSKLFCCRRVNKVDPTTGDETELKKCCFCIPCRRKRAGHGAAIGSTISPSGSVAWQDPESGIAASDASVLESTNAAEMQRPQGCCKRFFGKLLCCGRKKAPKPSESRRASMKAPPPPSEDTRRKLHVDLVEYTSKMKGAIPVLPLSLAWFCAICNTVFPGLGTLFSGIFCLCVGIPRFSQYDSAKARFGSFIINIIVATAQLFCVLFCFVGWGWSIWWGTIMLKCARKLSKIKKVERLEMEEERRQAEAAAIAAATAARAAPNAGVPAAAATTMTTESAA
ncbi:unnamed protein product [Ceratitis capitata]|uniref:(Mediterranean fruit fly) hypothetical protein n=2 Tax=Ceratitis capitata TaxID=7213 RepID=A0A811VFL5_CERCA|nr:unnamed protein product [Ceratitis capitata]